jgi:hypothetical protein
MHQIFQTVNGLQRKQTAALHLNTQFRTKKVHTFCNDFAPNGAFAALDKTTFMP